jgi:queuine tRNA-ribosyltransferase
VKPKYFKFKYGRLKFPVFFPDATRAVVRSLDTTDIENTGTQGVLVNTYHLYKEIGLAGIQKYGGVRKFMDFKGAVISDSGGFQVGSLIKKNPKLGKVTDEGVLFKLDNTRIMLTPEESIRFQMSLGTDMVVVLDDFDAPDASVLENRNSVERTIKWAERSKKEFDRICKIRNLSVSKRPYILGVIQGGRDRLLRKYCIDALSNIGFDGLGYGGEEKVKGSINYDLAQFIRDSTPKDYILYALGVGTPQDIVAMSKLGYDIFDCVLPTRDARHGRLYVYNSDSIKKIDLNEHNFYSTFNPDRQANLSDNSPVSLACDCLLCTRYSKAYLAHLFKINDFSSARLSTIHNLRFYSILMEQIRNTIDKK